MKLFHEDPLYTSRDAFEILNSSEVAYVLFVVALFAVMIWWPS